MVTLILIPTIKPNATAAKNAKITSMTPNKVIPIRDSTGSVLKTKSTEKTAMIAMETTTKSPLLSVISLSIRPVVPMTPESENDE